MTERTIKTEADRKLLYRFIAVQKLPFSLSLTSGRKRSIEQNRLQRLWCKEAAEQLGDRTAEDVRAECKLTFGVPILRHENEKFCEAYDANIKDLPYERKLAFMAEPLDFPVTRLMTAKQKTAYLDAIQQHFLELGIVLTDPGELLHVERETEAA